MGRLLLGFLLSCVSVQAYAADPPPIKLGVLTDMSGPYADLSGPGVAVAAQLAVDDFGGSVLGRPVQIITGDTLNKPDVASALAKQWYDADGVSAIVDGGNSATALAIQAVSRNAKRVFLASDGTTAELTGKACSPYSIHWLPDTYAIATAAARAMTGMGGKSWYFITADYVFGYDLERYASAVVTASGGKVVGAARHPLGTTDFSSYLLQARTSGADVVAFANAGTDLQNAIKQSREFGVVGPGGPSRMIALSIFTSDIEALGLDVAKGVIATADFYWDLDDTTRAWTKRYTERRNRTPTYVQVGAYSAVYHYLSAVKAVGSTDAAAVSAHMYRTPLADPVFKGIPIRADGRVLEPLYLMQVKTPAESTGPRDTMKVIGRIAPEDAYMPLDQTGCVPAAP